MNEFIHWCDEHIRNCLAQKSSLHADGRGDEASFMQIRANVYCIFRSVHTAVKGNLPMLLDKLTSIPAVWQASLYEAELHGDTGKAHIERIKLETAAAIRHYVINLQEASHD